MSNVDLARLDALFAALPQGEWRYGVSKSGRPQIYSRKPDGSTVQVAMVWGTAANPAGQVGPAICAMRDMLYAVAAELVTQRQAQAIDKGIYEATLIEKEVSDRLIAWMLGELGSVMDTRRSSESEIMAEFERLAAELRTLRARVAELEQERDGLAFELGKYSRVADNPALYQTINECLKTDAIIAERDRLRAERDAAQAEAAGLREALALTTHCGALDDPMWTAWKEANSAALSRTSAQHRARIEAAVLQHAASGRRKVKYLGGEE